MALSGTRALWLNGAMLLLTCFVLGCSGEPGPAQEPAAPAGNVLPTLTCGPEAKPKSSKDGLEQWCERGDGTMHGPYVKYYPDGVTREMFGRYDNGQYDDEWMWWHANGKQSQTGKYSKGKKMGSWTSWHPNGNRSEAGDFLQNRKAGQWTTWYESSHRKEEGLYHNDQKTGLWTVYNDDETNTVLRTEEYRNDTLVKVNGAPVGSPNAPTAPQKTQ